MSKRTLGGGRISKIERDVGVNSVLAWIDETRARADLDVIKAAGLGWVREELHWSRLEPQVATPPFGYFEGRFVDQTRLLPGQVVTPFDWTRTDGMMAAAKKAGVKVCVIFGLKNTQTPPLTDADRTAYARYVRLCCERYPEIGAAEICNEPYYSHFWNWPNPADYAKLARAVIPVIRAVRPGLPILLVGDVPKMAGAGWLAGIQAADPGLIPLADGLTIHNYPDPGTQPPDGTGDPRWTFKGQIELAAQAGKPLWITEVGWPTSGSTSVTETQQAVYLVRATELALADTRVARIFLYTWSKDGGDAGDREQHYGVRRQNGSFKPAWAALKTLLAGQPVPPKPPPTDRAAILADARAHMKRTTITYATWLKRKQSGYYKNPGATEWAQTDALLDQLV